MTPPCRSVAPPGRTQCAHLPLLRLARIVRPGQPLRLGRRPPGGRLRLDRTTRMGVIDLTNVKVTRNMQVVAGNVRMTRPFICRCYWGVTVYNPASVLGVICN